MSGVILKIRSLGPSAADKIVPPTGATARLTIFVAAAMAFMAVFAIAASLASARLADRWEDALDGVASIEVTSGDSADVERVLAVLETTPGVLEPEVVSETRQRELLSPWFGEDFPLEGLLLPRLVELREGSDLDRQGLVLRLGEEVPTAVYHNASDWQAQVARDAGKVGAAAFGLLVLTAGVVAALITLASTSSLVAQASVIETLRLIGAEDEFIARAFVRRFTMRGFAGAACGTVIGILLLLILTRGDGSFLSELRPAGPWGWLLFILIPFFAGLIALASTMLATRRILARLM
ncbi:cell division protein FtsX [Algicella marina]|uniref:Cell division protein FtsX n=1 Tax=Algicella marina TaxID=2683284 RepID=A0A6P1T700_9RHOB|nr:FtsX-like permease family protein [Algicella marina]QHQ37059.1 cell division protein FtsX [Algicella marina]